LQYPWRSTMTKWMPSEKPSSKNCHQLFDALLCCRTPPSQLLQLAQGPWALWSARSLWSVWKSLWKPARSAISARSASPTGSWVST
jgi:hypothetical protein